MVVVKKAIIAIPAGDTIQRDTILETILLCKTGQGQFYWLVEFNAKFIARIADDEINADNNIRLYCRNNGYTLYMESK